MASLKRIYFDTNPPFVQYPDIHKRQADISALHSASRVIFNRGLILTLISRTKETFSSIERLNLTLIPRTKGIVAHPSLWLKE